MPLPNRLDLREKLGLTNEELAQLGSSQPTHVRPVP